MSTPILQVGKLRHQMVLQLGSVSQNLNLSSLTPELTQLTMTQFPSSMCYCYNFEAENCCLRTSHSDSYSDTGSCVFRLVF